MKLLSFTVAVACLAGWIPAGCGNAGQDCTPREDTYCHEGVIYWVDSCGEFEELKEHCGCGCSPDHSGCEVCCTPHAQTYCHEGVTYWVDSCGMLEEEKEHCECGCNADRSDCPECGVVVLDELDFEGRILPGNSLVIHYQGPGQSLEAIDSSDNTLTSAAAGALELVPGWLRGDLRNSLVGLDDSDQDRYGDIILGAADAHYIDEIAYVIAHASGKDLQSAPSGIVSDNAASIYEIAADLPFVEIVENGQPGEDDHYTTVRHTVLVDGSEDTYDVPPEIYYRYIVFPIVDVEQIEYINPRTGNSATPLGGGVFWRDYLYYGGGDGIVSYITPHCLKSPNTIDDAFLAAADFGAAAAYGTFTDLEVGPIEVVRADGTDAPVAIMFVRGDGRCCNNAWPNPDGTYLATLMPVEAAAANGFPELLENLLGAGNANSALRDNTLVAVDNLWACQITEEPRRVLILRDRIPFDLPEDPNDLLLAGLGYEFDVMTSEDLETLVLFSTEPAHVNLDYNKIVIPSDQPRSFYLAIEDNASILETFVDYGGVLQMHLATREADDWADMRMPGGIQATAQTPENYVASVHAYGFPSLRDVLMESQAAWDGLSLPSLSGDRLFDPDESAIARIGWWGGQNTPQNIAEIFAWKRCRGIDRSWYAQRIVYNKYGNCGELADLLAAATRTALIPAKTAGTPNEDHTWGEFFTQDQWHPYQDDWSDSATRIDTWTIAYDADTGGSKTVTAVSSERGDGYQEHVLGRYEPVVIDAEGHITDDYSRYVTLEVRVTDAEGTPVDGALVLIASEGFYDPDGLYIVGWAYTDGDGWARVNMGEGNNYYVNVSCSQFGEIPAPSTVMRVARESQALPGEVFTIELAYDGDAYPLGLIEVPAASPGSYQDPPEGQIVELAIQLDVPRELMHGESLYIEDRIYTEPADGRGGRVDLYLVDRENYERFTAGDDFEAAAIHEGIDSLSRSFILPDPMVDWYVIVSNSWRLTSDQEVYLSAEAADVTYRTLPVYGSNPASGRKF